MTASRHTKIMNHRIEIFILLATILLVALYVNNKQSRITYIEHPEASVIASVEKTVLPIIVDQPQEPTSLSVRDVFYVVADEYSNYELQVLAYAIVEAESNFRNVCNTGGCRYGIGVFQIVQSTFDEQCEGDVYEVEDNIRCGFQMLDAGQVWRWKQSQGVWGVDNLTGY